MAYRLNITEKAEDLLDNLLYYLIYQLKNEQAAKHLLESISKIYDRLEENPFQFCECRDILLRSKGYREAILTDMDYLIIFKVEKEIVHILGIFHSLENNNEKV